MGRRSDHSREELKELILDAAWKVIERKGYNGLTVRKIAEQVNYAPGTIYNIFKSMDDLALHINARTVDVLYKILSDPACNDSNKTPVQNMHAMAKKYVDFARKYRPHWFMLFDPQISENRKSLAWYQEKIDRLFAPLEGLLESYFSAAQAKKRAVAARVLWASVHGVCLLEETGKIPVGSHDGRTPDMIEYLIDTFIKGVEQNKQIKK